MKTYDEIRIDEASNIVTDVPYHWLVAYLELLADEIGVGRWILVQAAEVLNNKLDWRNHD